MKIIYTALLLLCCVTMSAQDTLALKHPDYLPSMKLGTAAPEIVARDTTGTEIKLSSFRGKYVVLDFWATWCGDCRREIPVLKDLYAKEELRTIKSPGDVCWISFSLDDNEVNWRNFLRREELPWIHISNLRRTREDPTYKAYQLRWIPAFFIIDPEGNIIGKAITAKGLEYELIRVKKENSSSTHE